jgi:hypothetical protein
MKRLLLSCVISLLFVSGWSNVLAAALCPKMQDPSGCHIQAGIVTASPHEGHEGMETGDKQVRTPVTTGKVNSLERQTASCCTGRTAVPHPSLIVSKGAQQPKKELGAVLPKTLKAIELPAPVNAPPVTSRQHAPPPAATASRHLLISVFLI